MNIKVSNKKTFINGWYDKFDIVRKILFNVNYLQIRECSFLFLKFIQGQEVLSKIKLSTHPTEVRKKLVEMGNDHDAKVLKWKKQVFILINCAIHWTSCQLIV